MTLTEPPVRWPGRLAATWGILFAIPSFVWATGSTVGADSTVSPGLVQLARDRVPWFVAVLLATGALKLFGGIVALGLLKPRSRWLGRALVFCGGGAAILLLWHGGLFVVQGVATKIGLVTVPAEATTLSNWYLYLWGPWFLLGGLAFAGASALYVRNRDERRLWLFGVVGAGGGLAVSLVVTVLGIG